MFGVSSKKVLAPFLFITVLFAKQDTLDPHDCIQFTKRTLQNNGIIDFRFFTPDDSYTLQKVLVGLIEMEQAQIRALMFRLTNQPITDALVRAKKRGVKIELVVDSGACSLSHYSKVYTLTKVGIPLHVYQPMDVTSTGKGYQSLMHQKTLIFSNTFGRQVVATGSLNYTYAAFHGNEEVVTVRNNHEVFKDHLHNFSRVKARSYCYEMHPIKAVKKISGAIPRTTFSTINQFLGRIKMVSSCFHLV